MPVLAARSNPTAALGVAEGGATDGSTWFSLGFGGTITLGFDNCIGTGGVSIRLVEATLEPYPPELVNVYVSQDDSTYVLAATNVNKDATIALPAGMAWARFVKLVDVTVKSAHPADADAYDVDGVQSLTGCADVRGNLSGRKYQDTNRNGRLDAGEPGLAGWQIRIQGGAINTVVTTDPNGNWSFTTPAAQPQAGTTSYSVCEVGQTGWQQTGNTTNQSTASTGATATLASFCYQVTVPRGADATVTGLHFGNVRADTTPPTVACVPTTNPSGNNVPTAGTNPQSGQNPDGFYQLIATDNVDSNLQIYVADSGSTYVAGPFTSGDKVKITQAPGVAPNTKPGPGVITAHIQLKGDALVRVTDAAGNTTTVSCLVPPPPK
jgi:hypothetical protein